MEASTTTQVLLVANRTAATPTLIDKVRERADREPCAFTLLVPDLHRVADPDSREGEIILELAIPLLRQAVGTEVQGVVGDPDPYKAVQELLRRQSFDEIIVSTLPPRVSRWLATDLPGRLGALGPPVTVVTTPEAPEPVVSSSPTRT